MPTAIRKIALRSEKIGGFAGGTPKSDAIRSAATNKKAPTRKS